MKFILSAYIIFILAACKKDNPVAEQPLLQDGPLSAQLGKLVYLRDHGLGSGKPVWGRNSNEIFIPVSSKILRVDLADKTVAALETSGGAVTGKTNENSGVIIFGIINNENGFYTFNFNDNSIEKIVSVPPNQGTRIDIADNNVFFYQSPVSIPPPPCNGYCWNLPGPFVPATFYHLDKQTRQITDLKNKSFMLFSTDGSKTILSSQLQRRMYVFDNPSRTIIDSSDLNSSFIFIYGLFYYNGALQSYEIDVYGKITIKNFFNGQILRQYETNKVAFDGIKVSRDGTKLYYTAGFLNGGKLQIQLYDMIDNLEKTIVELDFLQGGGWPFDSFVLSDDNKKMAIKAGSDLYVKVLD